MNFSEFHSKKYLLSNLLSGYFRLRKMGPDDS
jgi:hypothetical protein